MNTWKARAHQLKTETYALYLACRDARLPWHVRIFILCIVGYALSPIDIIPDFIPVLGYLDDLVLIPLGITLALRMIPPPIMAECRLRAQKTLESGKRAGYVAAAVIVILWLLVAVLAVWTVIRLWKG